MHVSQAGLSWASSEEVLTESQQVLVDLAAVTAVAREQTQKFSLFALTTMVVGWRKEGIEVGLAFKTVWRF